MILLDFILSIEYNLNIYSFDNFDLKPNKFQIKYHENEIYYEYLKL